jgi:hypothetical protein
MPERATNPGMMGTLWPWRWRIVGMFVLTAAVVWGWDKLLPPGHAPDWFDCAWWSASGFAFGIIEALRRK